MATIPSTRVLTLLGAVLLSACASTSSSLATMYTAPDAAPLGFKGQKVVAAVLIKDESKRRLGEDRLAMQISQLGVQGRTLYSMVPQATAGDEQATRAALEREGVKGIVVMRPISVDRNVKVTPPYDSQTHASFWGSAGSGGYYGYGFSLSYTSGSQGSVKENTVVCVETLVYSLAQNKLVWGGISKSTDPETLSELIEQLSVAATSELKKEGLIQEQ